MEQLKKKAALILMVVAAGILILVVMQLLEAYQNYQDSQDTYNEMREEFVDHPQLPEEERISEKGYQFLQIDFAGLKAANPDVIGWIDIPGVGISYPVLQGEDNAYYLSHLASGAYGTGGSVFMDCQNHPDLSDQNTIIYGHNMRDDSMFGKLDEYLERSTYESQPYFYLYLPDKVFIYRILSAYEGYTDSVAYTYLFSTEEEFKSFLDEMLRNSVYDTGTQVGPEDRIVTLSTCTNTSRYKRFLVHGVLEQEQVNP